MTQPFLFGEGWIEVRDGDDTARALFERHYSCRKGDRPRRGANLLIVGPGEKLVLLTPCARALFVWRREQNRRDGQEGVGCAVFRNEGAGLSSDLVRQADALADRRWPGERHYTHVDPERVRSTNPGFCFLAAGWRRCGVTKHNRLLILERPAPAPQTALGTGLEEAVRW